jgi:hypothetical protein
VKKLALTILSLPLLLAFMLAMSGTFIGHKSGLKMMQYIPSQLTPTVEVSYVIKQEQR